MDWKPHITDNTETVVLIFLIYRPSLLVGAGQHYLWTTPHTHRGGMAVQGLGREILTLFKDIVVEVRQDTGIESNGVLDEHNHLHPTLT